MIQNFANQDVFTAAANHLDCTQPIHWLTQDRLTLRLKPKNRQRPNLKSNFFSVLFDIQYAWHFYNNGSNSTVLQKNIINIILPYKWLNAAHLFLFLAPNNTPPPSPSFLKCFLNWFILSVTYDTTLYLNRFERCVLMHVVPWEEIKMKETLYFDMFW